MSKALLNVEDLSGGYGDVMVVQGFTAAICSGEVAFVAGRNGVGKSTLVKLITASLPAASGQVKLRGKDMTSVPAHRRRSLGLGYAPQENVVFSELTVEENLVLHYRSRSLGRYDRLFGLFPVIGQRLQQRAGTLSGGEKKVLSFCRALAEDTGIVILDEPTEGVQPENIRHMRDVIRAEAESGRGFLIVEQNLNFIDQTAHNVYLLDHGECVYKTSRRDDLRDQLASRLKI